MGRLGSAVVLCVLGASSAAAHEAQRLQCSQTFNGAQVLIVDTFPATVNVKLVVTNSHATSTSIATAISAPILENIFMSLQTPVTLAPGASFTSEKTMTISDLASCGYISTWDGDVDSKVASAVRVSWSGGAAHCSGAIVCRTAQVCR